MDPAQRDAFNELLKSEAYEGVRAMNKTVFEEGVEKGVEKGILKATLAVMKAKFGIVPTSIKSKLKSLFELLSAIPNASSISELKI
jgi:hypothetical protein